jgi:glycosyltransferase involved in cell wall biosynthesis
LARLSTRRQSKTVFISKGLLRWQLDNKETSLDAETRIVHYGIKKINNIFLDQKSNSSASLTIGCAGRLVAGKDIKTLILAIEKVKAKSNILNLLIAGDGPEKNNLEQLVVKLNLESNVKFLGKISEMDNFFAQIDVFVHPSIREGFGLVVLEAMSRGIPVIAANNTSLPELVSSPFNGFLFETGNFEDLATKICLLYDYDLRCEMGKNAMQKAQREFDIKISSSNLLSVMQEL